MEDTKRARLEAAGFTTTTIEELLDLTPEESAMIELRLTLAKAVREQRQRHHLSQTELASRIGSSQSRIAKMEVADKSVSTDLTLRALLAIVPDPREIWRMLGRINQAQKNEAASRKEMAS